MKDFRIFSYFKISLNKLIISCIIYHYLYHLYIYIFQIAQQRWRIVSIQRLWG